MAHTKKRYGVTGKNLHRWIDEPSLLLAGSHRKYRHDPNTELPLIYIEEFGKERARDIHLDHLYLDKKNSRKKTKWRKKPDFYEFFDDFYKKTRFDFHDKDNHIRIWLNMLTETIEGVLPPVPHSFLCQFLLDGKRILVECLFDDNLNTKFFPSEKLTEWYHIHSSLSSVNE